MRGRGEVFNRLNTGGINLRPQEIRMSMYHSKFYDMLYKANSDADWRLMLGNEEPDLHLKDVEILLRGFALLIDGENYSPSMVKFLNQFSRKSRAHSKEQNDYLLSLLGSFFSAVDKFFEEANAVVQLLQQEGQVSLQITAADHFRKALLLASASYFEQRVCEAVLEFVRQRSKGSVLIENFVKNKAVARQYHTWFSWDKRNANQFFGFFGEEFRRPMVAKIDSSPEMQKSIQAFLELGNERNKLVHQNYVGFPMEKTLDEIYQLHQNACRFVDGLLTELLDFDK
jgi:hypothetical protein